MKKTCTLLLLLAVAFAQAADEWTSYYADNSVQIFYRYADCHDDANGIHQQKVLFRFVNLSAAKVELSFAKELTYTNTAANAGDKVFKISLAPNQTAEGDCQTKDKALFAFSKFLNRQAQQLTKFELKNISVTVTE
ncbi:MAG: hypothetical protein KIS94_03665 [Chitinophagales bacterium]|nr:hypothetical protein [Chitinophagales bacterium]